MSTSTSSLPLFCVVLALLVGACDTTEENTGASGRFSAGVIAEISEGNSTDFEFSGTVYFAEGVDEETGEQRFGLYMTPDEDTDFTGSEAILFRFAERPETEEYFLDSIDPQDDTFVGTLHLVAEEQNYDTFFTFTDGTVTIETSTSERVRGSFQIDSEGPAGPFQNVIVQGKFDAPRQAGGFKVPVPVADSLSQDG